MAITDDTWGAGQAPGDIWMVGYGPPALYVDGGDDHATTADHADLDITGDIDIRVACALDDWNPSAGSGQSLVCKADAYELRVSSGGASPGSVQMLVAGATRTSSTTPSVSDGGVICLRATVDVNNGAGGHDVKFYTRTFHPLTYMDDLEDDTIGAGAWVQLGTTQTAEGTISLTSNANALFVGAGGAGGTSNEATGRFYGVAVKNGIDGTTVTNPDFGAQLGRDDAFSDTAAKSYSVGGNAFFQPSVRDDILFCDGTVYDIADFPELFEAIGARFGGDGATTFAVPNMVGFFPLGSLTPGTGAGSATTTGNLTSGTPSGTTNIRQAGSASMVENTHTHLVQVPNVKLAFVIKT